jgi:predicted DNA-binding transcriptional regulator AlpA
MYIHQTPMESALTVCSKNQPAHPRDSETRVQRRSRLDRVRHAIDLTAVSGGDVLLRGPEVAAVIGVSMPTLYRMIGDGDFPPSIAPTRGTRAWPMSVVQDWIRELIANGGKDAR